jgi:ATP-dependent DNA helicase PIF1
MIWDEALMMHRWCFEALDKSLRDIMSYDGVDNSNKPSGGISIVLGNDFRQILSVIRKGCRQDIMAAAIDSSKLWDHCKVLKLTTNTCLSASSVPAEQIEIKMFAEWILSIGNGDGSANESGEISLNIPDDLLIQDLDDPLRSLIDFVYPDF